MKRIITIIALALLLGSGVAQARDFFTSGWLHDAKYVSRLGYSIGGTTPMGMPATIRQLNDFNLTPNLQFGLDVFKPVTGTPWGVQVGIHFENKGMSEDATVKNYHMEITRGGETLEGMFTGREVTKVMQWMFTVPLQATYTINRVRIKLGPYVSYLTGRGFDGYAYNGYLRVGDPTGAKVELGETQDERGDYDFATHMRKWQTGFDLGADWRLTERFGVYADLSWGITSIFKSNFHTVEQTLYPVYGTVGVVYRVR